MTNPTAVMVNTKAWSRISLPGSSGRIGAAAGASASSSMSVSTVVNARYGLSSPWPTTAFQPSGGWLAVTVIR